ncbi:MAG: hypothetical protein NTV34_18200 [Proteobacteria bacterium]|nr:hypothetical protein [Pseudomonadota bacterium]
MAQRWLVHSRDRILGPWNGPQVRDELRAGRIDPFDMVSQENSSVKRPLVEVDEIFHSSRVQMAEIIQARSAEPPVIDERQDATVIAAIKVQEPNAVGADYPPPRPSQFQALAAESSVFVGAKNQVAPKNGVREKKYFITDSTGRTLGPMSSKEVIEVWRNGKIDGRAIVQRRDQPRRISIEKFVSYYERSAPSGFAFLTAGTHLNPSFKLGYKTPRQGLLAWIVITMASVALGFLCVTLYQAYKLRGAIPGQKVPITQRFDLKANEVLAGKIAPVKRTEPANSPSGGSKSVLPVSAPAQAALPASATRDLIPSKVEINAKNTAKQEKRRAARKAEGKKAEAKALKQVRNAAARAAPKSPQPSLRTQTKVFAPLSSVGPGTGNQGRVALSSPALPRKTSPMGSAKSLAKAENSPQNPPKNSQEKAAPVPMKQASSWVEGQVVTLVGYKFSAAALGVCEGKCKIPMTGSKGTITAVFFKQAHGDTLKGKTGGAAVTGMIRKSAAGDWQIIVSQVK